MIKDKPIIAIFEEFHIVVFLAELRRNNANKKIQIAHLHITETEKRGLKTAPTSPFDFIIDRASIIVGM